MVDQVVRLVRVTTFRQLLLAISFKSHSLQLRGISLTLLATIFLSGCSSPFIGATSSDSASNSASTKVVAPLTGASYDSGANSWLTGPAIMAKIDNVSDARPQAGLNQADLVFDEMVEGGLTRLLAVWHSNVPAVLGPVRSVRPMDPDIASPFGGIICFSGGQAPFVQAMAASPVFSATETNQQGKHTFKRVTDRFAPHNVMISAQHLQGQHLDLAPPKPPFTFATSAAQASAAVSGSNVLGFTVRFPSATANWTWNVAKQVWLRVQDGQPQLDANDQTQLHAANVVVIPVTIDRSYIDPRYGFVPRSLLIGEGTAYIFSQGKMLKATYKKADKTSAIQLFDASGNPIKLAVGNTWFELQPKDVGSLSVVYPPTASPTPSASAAK